MDVPTPAPPYAFVTNEVGSPWTLAHFVNPLLFTVFWQRPVWTFVLVAGAEVLEVFGLATYGGVPGFIENDADTSETLESSLVGDVATNGLLGLLVGYWLTTLFAVPAPLVSSDTRVRVDGGGRVAPRAALIVAWLAPQAAFFVLAAVRSTTLYTALVVGSLVLGGALHVAAPYATTLVWRADYSRGARALFFATLIAIVVFVAAVRGAAANDWYGVWASAGVVAAQLALANLALRRARVLDGALTLTAAAGALLVYAGIRQSTAARAVGSVLAAGGVGALLLVAIARSYARSTRPPPPPSSSSVRPPPTFVAL